MAGGKGGVGKTLLSIALAHVTGATLVDCDVTEPDVPAYLPLEPKKELFEVEQPVPVRTDGCRGCGECERRCPWDALEDPMACDGCGICAAACPEDAIVFEKEVLGRVVEAECEPLGMTVRYPDAEPWAPELASVVVGSLADLDVFVADCPAGLGCPVIATLTSVDAVVLVGTPHEAALHDLERARALAEDLGLPTVSVLNMADDVRSENFDVVVPVLPELHEASQSRDPEGIVEALEPYVEEIVARLPV